MIVLSNSVYPDHFQVAHEFEFDPSMAELRLRGTGARSRRDPYDQVLEDTKAADEITSTSLSQKECRDRYAGAIHQVALRTFHEVFESDRRGLIKTISLEVGANTIDPATGQRTDMSVFIAAAERKSFLAFALSAVVPALHAGPAWGCRFKESVWPGRCPALRSPPIVTQRAPVVFNPPPGWPKPPKEWIPPKDWQPDPAWPTPPPGSAALDSRRHPDRR